MSTFIYILFAYIYIFITVSLAILARILYYVRYIILVGILALLILHLSVVYDNHIKNK